MSRVTFFLLSCFMALALVVYGLPQNVNHPDAQCTSQGYKASCDNLSWDNFQLNCGNIFCAGRKIQPSGSDFKAESIGPATDGTKCARNKICIAGVCVDLPPGQRMPREVGMNRDFYTCLRTDSAPLRPSGRN